MANPEHLEILNQGVEVWNKWREENPDVVPDLSGEDLRKTDLSGAYLEWADLSRTNLRRLNLRLANLSRTKLYKANLNEVDLQGAKLILASLIQANIRGANLSRVVLRGANLSMTDLSWTNFSDSDLSYSDLTNSLISYTNFHFSVLKGANFSKARLHYTILTNVNLNKVKNLETCIHHGPSNLDYPTLQQSWPLPDAFLRGVGFPDQWIEFFHDTLSQPTQFYSFFISYCHKDEDFAKLIHDSLQGKNIRCWKYTKDMPVGAEIRPTIYNNILRLHDKLLLVVSEHSIRSEWVKEEVEVAFEKENKSGAEKIITPIFIDRAFLEIDDVAWVVKLRQRHCADFTGWKDHDKYRAAFEQLLKWLKS